MPRYPLDRKQCEIACRRPTKCGRHRIGVTRIARCASYVTDQSPYLISASSQSAFGCFVVPRADAETKRPAETKWDQFGADFLNPVSRFSTTDRLRGETFEFRYPILVDSLCSRFIHRPPAKDCADLLPIEIFGFFSSFVVLQSTKFRFSDAHSLLVAFALRSVVGMRRWAKPEQIPQQTSQLLTFSLNLFSISCPVAVSRSGRLVHESDAKSSLEYFGDAEEPFELLREKRDAMKLSKNVTRSSRSVVSHISRDGNAA